MKTPVHTVVFLKSNEDSSSHSGISEDDEDSSSHSGISEEE